MEPALKHPRVPLLADFRPKPSQRNSSPEALNVDEQTVDNLFNFEIQEWNMGFIGSLCDADSAAVIS